MKNEIGLDLPDKDLLSVNELARAMDKHVSTIYRWGSLRGVRGRRLRLVRIGGRTYVQRADLETFLRALNSPSTGTSEGATSEQLHNQAAVDAQLDAAGF